MAGNIARDILVRLRLSSEDFKGKIREAEAGVRAFGSSVGSAFRAVQANWLAVTAAVTGTSYAISRAIRYATEWENAQERMRIMARGNAAEFGRMRSAVESYSGDLFSKTQIANAYAMGQAVGLTGDKLDALFPLLLRHAATMGTDVTQAMHDFAGAIQSGMAQTIRFQGVQLEEIDLNKKASEEYGTKFDRLSDVQKQAVRYLSVLEQLNRMYADEGEGLAKTSDAVGRLRAAWSDLNALEISTGPVRGLLDGITSVLRGFEDIDKWLIEHSPTDRRGEMRQRRIAEEQARMGPPEAGAGGPWGDYGDASAMGAPTAREQAEERFQNWKTDYVARADKERIENEYRMRYAREQVGPAWGAEPGIVGGYEPSLADGDALKDMLVEQAKVRQAIAIEDEERQNEIWRNGLETRLELQQAMGDAMASGWETMYGAMNSAGDLFWNREYLRGKKLTHLAKYVAKESLAAVVEGLGQEAKEQAKVSFILAASFAARGMWSAAAQMAYVGAQWAAYAGTTAVVAGAIRGGAARELAAAGAERERAPGQITASGSESGGSRTVTGQLSASIARAPETVNINVTNVFEGPNVVGADASALRAFYDDHIRQWVADDQRANVLEAA
jgi:hypothetical protein